MVNTSNDKDIANLKSVLIDALINDEITNVVAKKLLSNDWRLLVAPLPVEIRREAEIFFYFVEGFVEEVEEGFVNEGPDEDLRKMAINILAKL